MTLLAAAPVSLPFRDPVLIVALASAIFLVVPLLFERIRVPGIIGLIVTGAVIGPHGLGLLARDQTIVLLGTVGLLYLMFLVGLELDLDEFNRHRGRSVVFGLLSFALPQVTGTALSLMLGYALPSAVLLGAMFASHTLLAYPIASRLGIIKTASVTTVLGATLLTDMLALLVLAIVDASTEGELGPAFWAGMAAKLAAYSFAVLWGVPRLARWFFRHARTDGSAEYLFTFAVLFLCAHAAHVAGIEPIIGALLAGFAMNRLIPEQSPLMIRTKFVANTVFVPFFLLSVGMLVDVRAFARREAWVVIGALVAAVLLSKGAAAWVTRRVFRLRAEEGWVLFGLSVSHAAATMAITLVGYDRGLFDETVVNAVVVVILVTCLAGPWAVERYGRKVALLEQRRPYEPGDAPRRVLVPLANPATAPALVDLALAVRGAHSREALRLLNVVPGRNLPEAEVAEAERMLATAVEHAAAADAAALPVTRVDPNAAAGIERAATETRSSVVVIGWDGRRSGARVVFGTVLDRLIENARQTVVVARLRHPLNTTRRLVAILPPAIDRHPGFLEALRTVNLAASGLGATLTLLQVGGDDERVRALHAGVRPAVQAAWERVEGWAELLSKLDGQLTADDLPVLVSTRRGTLSWHPRLARLPEQLTALAPASFLVLYPPEPEAPDDASSAPLADGVAPARVVRLAPEISFVAAIGRMLEPLFDADTARELANVVVRNEEQFSSEIVPGVVLPHVRLKGLPAPVLALGVSREGVRFPKAREPARLVFLLVSPAERAEEHLRYLADIARLLSRPERVRELLARFAPDTELDWLHVDD